MEGKPGQYKKQWLFAVWLAAVVFVFPIPHTIALRNLLLLIGVVMLLWTGRKSMPKLEPWLKFAAWWLVALTAWIVIHSVAVAPVPTLALDQFRANWLIPLLLGGIGAWAATQLPREQAPRAVVLALAAHMIWLLGWQFEIWLVSGTWPFKGTPFGSYDFQGTLNSFLLVLLLADRLAWILERYSPLALGRRPGWALLLLSVVSDLALQSRNSTVVSLFMLLVASFVLLNRRSHRRNVVAGGMGVVILLTAGSLSFDSRWQGLRESSLFGWSSPGMHWITPDAASRPTTPSGAPLEASAYLRATMARQSIDFIAEHPLGIGFGHDAFGRAVAMKFKHPGMGSSHSGWLDFALGTGLIGLGLLLAVAVSAASAAWREFRERQDAQALLLAFFVGGYTLRCLLDGHLSGWRLGLFAFIIGVLIAGMKNPRTDS
jgi:hypothetical protein